MTRGGKAAPKFSWPADLCSSVRHLPDTSCVWVALSGGLDSVLLLHVVSSCLGNDRTIAAIHVNHQLQANAGETEQFCRKLCESLGVPLTVERVTVPTKVTGESTTGGIEEAARNARYDIFERALKPGHILLMAHHGDDQAETVLFRLLRGSGVAGLAGMPASRALGKGELHRPFLAFSRQQIRDWAQLAGLEWVEDPSNTDQKYDRNFLRHSVMPLLKSRWPSLIKRLWRSAEACRDQEELAASLARIHYASVGGGEGGRLRIAQMLSLSLAEQKNLLHWWITGSGYRYPAVADWQQVLDDLLRSAADREPEFRGEGFSLRRFRGGLYLVPAQPGALPVPQSLKPGHPVQVGPWRFTLSATVNSGDAPPPIRISTRQGGERIRTRPGGPSKPLKKWLQEQQVPPWERARIPLLFEGREGGGELVAVGDLWLSGKYCGEAPAAGWRIVVEREFD
ncbi:tRNA lysidine(34) synthetase TilS [Marinobacter lipolyticus]|uniref:tRNA lysidine(34) synthetase TilS n=1 Tax=Marinobacter lipolyticus TaxID=209639 RepID=UPI003A95721F